MEQFLVINSYTPLEFKHKLSSYKTLGSTIKTELENQQNTSLAAPGALAHRLQRRTACNTTEASLHSPNKKTQGTSL